MSTRLTCSATTNKLNKRAAEKPNYSYTVVAITDGLRLGGRLTRRLTQVKTVSRITMKVSPTSTP